MNFSVLISVYKAEQPEFLQQAIESIYHNQTLKPSQVVIVKDGPLPEKLEQVLERYQTELQETLTVVSLPKNVGLGAALNAGLAHCRYELVARMDTDDISLPHRFECQITFMAKNPDVSASSAFLEEYDSALTMSQGFRKVPVSHDEIVRFGKRRSPLNHIPSVFRKRAVESVGGYPALRNAQDYALWSLLIVHGHKLANIPQTLAHIRAGEGLIERRGFGYLKKEVQLLMFQKKVGYLSWFDFLINFLIRATIRTSPTFLKKLTYRVIRKLK